MLFQYNTKHKSAITPTEYVSHLDAIRIDFNKAIENKQDHCKLRISEKSLSKKIGKLLDLRAKKKKTLTSGGVGFGNIEGSSKKKTFKGKQKIQDNNVFKTEKSEKNAAEIKAVEDLSKQREKVEQQLQKAPLKSYPLNSFRGDGVKNHRELAGHFGGKITDKKLVSNMNNYSAFYRILFLAFVRISLYRVCVSLFFSSFFIY